MRFAHLYLREALGSPEVHRPVITVCNVKLGTSGSRPAGIAENKVKSISPETQRLIYDLSQPRGFVKKLTTSRIDVSLLISIGNSKEPAAVIEILPFVLSRKRDVANAAASAVHKLVHEATSEELLWLDYSLRRRSPYSGDFFYEWHKISPDHLQSFMSFGAYALSLLGMASFHRTATSDKLQSTHSIRSPKAMSLGFSFCASMIGSPPFAMLLTMRSVLA